MTHSQNNILHCLNLPICTFNLSNTKRLDFKMTHSKNVLQGFNSFSKWAIAGKMANSNDFSF